MRPLGEYLVEDGVLKRGQVESVLLHQRLMTVPGRPRQRFGQIVLDVGLVTRDQLDRALRRQEIERHEPAQT